MYLLHVNGRGPEPRIRCIMVRYHFSIKVGCHANTMMTWGMRPSIMSMERNSRCVRFSSSSSFVCTEGKKLGRTHRVTTTESEGIDTPGNAA